MRHRVYDGSEDVAAPLGREHIFAWLIEAGIWSWLGLGLEREEALLVLVPSACRCHNVLDLLGRVTLAHESLMHRVGVRRL